MDISLSASEIALITVLLGAVTTPLTMLFRMLIADKDRQIGRLEKQNEDLLSGILSGTKAVENSTQVTTQVLRQRTQ